MDNIFIEKQLKEYQDALESWVLIAQKHEKTIYNLKLEQNKLIDKIIDISKQLDLANNINKMKCNNPNKTNIKIEEKTIFKINNKVINKKKRKYGNTFHEYLRNTFNN